MPAGAFAQSTRSARNVTAVGTADIREMDAELTRQARRGSMVLRSSEADTLLPGRMVERYDQYYRGVRVDGGLDPDEYDVIAEGAESASRLRPSLILVRIARFCWSLSRRDRLDRKVVRMVTGRVPRRP